MIGPRIVRLLWGLAGAVVLLIVLKFFVADVYRIRSGSMRPTLFGGESPGGGPRFTEWVLVRYGRNPPPSRFDLVVLEPRAGEHAVVKRVVALPGETVRIVEGDLVIDGTRLARDEPRPAPIPVFDDRMHAVDDLFHFKRDGPWSSDDEGWRLDAADIPVGHGAGMMLFHPDVRDDHIDPDGRRVAGLRQANDVILECEFALESAATTLRFLLVEEGDTFTLEVAPISGGPEGSGGGPSHEVRLLRSSVRWAQEPDPTDRVRELAAVPCELELERWYRVRFANVDDHLESELPDAGVALRHSYAGNDPIEEIRAGDRSRGARAGLGGGEGGARFRRIRVLRDQLYTSTGTYAVQDSVSLGPDEVFLLGDDSARSQDSRFFGPVRLSELVGRPVAVVWPPRGWRLLEGARGREEDSDRSGR